MVEQLAAPALVAALGGLAFLAYRHPSGYRILATVLSLVGAIGLAEYTAYEMGLQVALDAVQPHLAAGAQGAAVRAVSEHAIAWWPALIVVGTLVYIQALRLLPLFTGDEEDAERKKPH